MLSGAYKDQCFGITNIKQMQLWVEIKKQKTIITSLKQGEFEGGEGTS